jgi:hypothetical protein
MRDFGMNAASARTNALSVRQVGSTSNALAVIFESSLGYLAKSLMGKLFG